MAQPKTNASQEAGAAMPATPPRENLYRAAGASPLIKPGASGSEMPTMVVDFARFGEWTVINSAIEGHFLERLAPGSMDKTIAESRDQMKVLFNHGKDPSIGDKVLGPIATLEANGDRARGTVPLLDTSYNRDLVPGLKAGLYGSSFRFQVMQEDFNSRPKRAEHNPSGIPERTITEARVREWGPVTFPAYANATSGLRSITDEFVVAQLLDDEQTLERLAAEIAKRKKPDRQTFTVSFNGVPMTPTEEIVEPEEVRDEAEPEPSEATTPDPGLEPEPPVATTRAVTPNKGLYPNREEKPAWLL